MKVLVTGANGFIGSHLVDALVAQGDEVVALIFSKDPVNHLDPNHKVKRVRGDIRDANFVRAIMKGCKGVYHLAAALNDQRTTREDFITTNIIGTRNIMDAALHENVKRVVHTSSMAAIKDTRDRIDEEYRHQTFFDGFYSMTKYKGEKIAFEYGARGIDVVVVAPTIVYGPRETHTLGQIFRRHIEPPIRIGAFLDAPLNLLYVEDAAVAYIAAMKKGEKGQRYLLGGDEISTGTFLKMMDSVANINKPLIKIPNFLLDIGVRISQPVLSAIGITPPLLKPQVEAMKRGASVDIKKARTKLNIPTTPIREGLEKTLAWYKEKGFIRF